MLHKSVRSLQTCTPYNLLTNILSNTYQVIMINRQVKLLFSIFISVTKLLKVNVKQFTKNKIHKRQKIKFYALYKSSPISTKSQFLKQEKNELPWRGLHCFTTSTLIYIRGYFSERRWCNYWWVGHNLSNGLYPLARSYGSTKNPII